MAILFRAHNQDVLLQGEVDAPEMIVASKPKGRVVKRLVERGDNVNSGQLLIQLDSPELIAQLRSAQATRDKAKAQLEQSMHGTRERASAPCVPIWRRPRRNTVTRRTITTAT